MRSGSVSGFWAFALTLSLFFAAFGQELSVDSLIAQGRTLESAGKFSRAEELFRAAYKQVQKKDASQTMAAAVILDGLATTASDQGRYADAERFLLQSLAISERAAGPDATPTGAILWHLATIYGDCGDWESAAPLVKRYESIVMRHAAADPSNAALELGNVGRIYLLRSDAKKAMALFDQALGLLENEAKSNGYAFARTLLDRARAYSAIHAFGPANADLERARLSIAGMPDASPSLQIERAITAGTIATGANQAAEAEAAFLEAIHLTETLFGPTHPVLALILNEYANSLRSFHKKKEASAIAGRAKQITGASGGKGFLGQTVSIYTLR